LVNTSNVNASKKLIQEYFKERSLVNHNINSFNDFINVGLQKVVNSVGEVVPDIIPPGVKKLSIKFGKIFLKKPFIREADGTKRKLMPMEARLRNVTYAAPILLEMSIIKDGIETESNVINIGDLPIMVKSNYCYLHELSEEELIRLGEDPTDPGGYFIINGTERVVVVIEDLAPNKVFAEKKKTGSSPYVAKVFSEQGRYRIPHLLEKRKNGVVYLSFTRLKRIPVVIVMKALGVNEDKKIMEFISEDEALRSDVYINLFQAENINTQEEALIDIGKRLGVTHSEEKAMARGEEIIDTFLLPHIGNTKKDRLNKARFLGRAIKKLLLVSHDMIEEDDKDHYGNKRLRLAGDLLQTLFISGFRMLAGDMKYNFERLIKRGRIPSLTSVVRSQLLTSRIKSALATGEWVGNRHGVSQHLDRVNRVATLSHLRRVVSLLTASRENFEARDLHPTHWGKLCASETPEGPSVGLRKNLAILCEISGGMKEDKKKLIKTLTELGMKKPE